LSNQRVSTDPADPRLADFVGLNDPQARREIERRGNYFVVEGIVAIERLLGLAQWNVRMLALLPKVAERLAPLLVDRGVPTVVADEDTLRTVVGFDIHRGALASVDRRAPVALDAVVHRSTSGVLVCAEGINDHENLGSLYRNAAAFGAIGVALDPTSADPFYRRSVRVSQGNVLVVPTSSMAAAPEGIERLQALGATVLALTPAGEVDLTELSPARLGPGPIAVLVGAEGPGLTGAARRAADHRVAIRVRSGVDSLNVATAAAIALHHLGR